MAGTILELQIETNSTPDVEKDDFAEQKCTVFAEKNSIADVVEDFIDDIERDAAYLERVSVADVEKDSCCRCRSPVYSRIASSASVSSIASFPEYDLKPNLKITDLKSRLSELIECKGPDLIKACRNFDRRSTNKIPKAQFRQVLRTFCFPVTAAQFDILCNEVKINQPGKINYMNFFKNMSSGKSINANITSEKISDDLPIDEVELRIKNKIKSRLYDVIRAFWLFDINKDGLIQKTELRRIIRNYCFDLSEDLFNDLWKSYDPKATGLIKYKDFLIKLGINADRYEKYMPAETVAHALCFSDQKSKDMMDDISCEQRSRRAALEKRDDPAIQGLPLEEVLTIFLDRLQRRAKLLKNTFKLFDYEKNGQISLSDFHEIINFFVLPFSSTLFNRVLERLPISPAPDSKMYYQDFLDKFCNSSCEPKESNKRESKKLDCHPLVQRIKNHVINPDARLRSVFTKIDQDCKWQVTRQELKRAIEIGLDFRLSDDEFKELTTILDPGNTNTINCVDFLLLFDGPCDSKSVGTEKSSSVNKSSSVYDAREEDKYVDLGGKRLKNKMKHHLNKNMLNIERALLVCDLNQSGFISPAKLHNILNGFCFHLTDDQFEELISDAAIYGDVLNYKEFLNAFIKAPDEDTKKWTSIINKLATFKSRCPPELPADEVNELLRECIQARKTAIERDFEALDVCNVGVACKEDVRSVLNKFAFRFNDKQFQALWKKFPVNKYGQLLYKQFLEDYSDSGEQPKTKFMEPKDFSKMKSDKQTGVEYFSKTSIPESGSEQSSKQTDRKKTMSTDKQNQKTRQANKYSKNQKEILYERAPHLKPIIDPMESAIIRNLRVIRFDLRRADPKVTGSVDFAVLQKILAKSGVYVSDGDAFHLLEYFDSDLSGKINYRDFLMTFVWYA